jgi:hypothetical protein
VKELAAEFFVIREGFEKDFQVQLATHHIQLLERNSLIMVNEKQETQNPEKKSHTSFESHSAKALVPSLPALLSETRETKKKEEEHEWEFDSNLLDKPSKTLRSFIQYPLVNTGKRERKPLCENSQPERHKVSRTRSPFSKPLARASIPASVIEFLETDKKLSWCMPLANTFARASKPVFALKRGNEWEAASEERRE